MRGWWLLFGGFAATALAPTLAVASPPTHALALTAVDEKSSDCARGQCTPTCKLTGTLSMLQYKAEHASIISKSAPINVIISYSDDNVEGGRRATELEFGKLTTRSSTAKATEWINSFWCRDVKNARVTAQCPGRPDGKCPGLYDIKVAATPTLHIAPQIITAK